MNNYQLCLILSFQYDKKKFNLLANEKNGLITEFFNKKKITSSGMCSFFNESGENFFLEKDPSAQMVYKYKFDDNKRQALGIMHNKNYRYQFKTENIFLKIIEIYMWFFKNGRAYLTIRLGADNPNNSQILKINSQVNWMDVKFSYEKGRNKIKNQISFKELTENCIKDMDKELRIVKTENSVYQLSYLLTNLEKNEVFFDFLERYRIGKALENGSIMTMKKEAFFDVKDYGYNYILWGFSEKRLVMHGDCGGHMKESNIEILQGQLRESIFSKYLVLYLYYINLLQRCVYIEQQQKNVNNYNSFNTELMNNIVDLEKTVPELVNLNGHEHIKELFRKLCEYSEWNLNERLKEIHSYDVFISYRHDGGQYLALLLYHMLSLRGIQVFLDNKSLRAGKFDEQLVEAIIQSKKLLAIISPGSVERLKDDDDWVRKEIACALKAEVTIIPVVMERVQNPKKEELPEDIQGLADCHSIVNSSIDSFDGIIDKLCELIRG